MPEKRMISGYGKPTVENPIMMRGKEGKFDVQ